MKGVWAVAVVVGASSGWAQPLEQGLTWLRAQQSPSGELGAARGEQTVVATTEAVATWQALGLGGQPEALAALASLGTTEQAPDTELALRRRLALQDTAWNFSQVTHNGHADGFDAPEAWLMEWSLLSGPADAAWVSRALTLVSRLDPQGCLAWADNPPSVELTAMAVLALRRRADVPALGSGRNALLSCLRSLQRPGGDFGDVGATATALLALQSVATIDLVSIASARAALLATQTANGSWGTVRATALALRALGTAAPDWEARTEFGRALVTVSAGTVLQGSPVSARAQFRNSAASTAPPVLVRFSLKQGSQVLVSQEVWLPSLAAGELAEVSAALPTLGLGGQYVVEAEANASRLLPELDFSNNLASAMVSVLREADLAVTSGSIQFLPDTATTARVRVSVQNRGATLAVDAVVSAWAFAPMTGRALGSFAVPAGTAAGAVVTGELVFSTTDLSGFTAIHVIADPSGVISEYDESNNAAFRYFEKGAQNAVDLAATTIVSTTPSPAMEGEPFVLRGQVNNVGGARAQRIGVSVFEEGSNVFLGRTEIDAIEPGSAAFFQLPMTLAQSGALTIIVDPDESLNDTNRANNRARAVLSLSSRRENFELVTASLSASSSAGMVDLTALVRCTGLSGSPTLRVRELRSGTEVASRFVSISGDITQSVTLRALPGEQPAKVYEVCIDPDNRFLESIETDNCFEVSTNSSVASLQILSRNIQFEPVGADVGESVRLSATALNSGAEPRSFSIEFFQGRPRFPEARFIGRSSVVSAPAGGTASATLQWVREEGPIEVYARIVAVDARVPDVRPLVAGRHLFLEEVLDLGLPSGRRGGVHLVRTGRLTGTAAPDLVLGYSVYGQGDGVALVSSGPQGRSVAWKRPLGNVVKDIALVDVERDGQPEILVLHGGFDQFVWLTALLPDGTTKWSRAFDGPLAGCGQVVPRHLALGDLDSDGVADVTVFSQATRVLSVSGATGATIVETQVVPYYINCGAEGSMYIADTDGDGRNEVIGIQNGDTFKVERDGTLRWRGAVNVNSHTFALADLDSDGSPELVFPEFKGSLFALRSDNGTLKLVGAFRDGWPASIGVSPVRQDGLPSVLASNNSGDVRVGAFSPDLRMVWDRAVPRTLAYPMEEVTLSDLTGAGRPQALYANWLGGPLMVDARNGRTLIPAPVENQNTPTSTRPVVADLNGNHTAKVVLGFSGSGTVEYPGNLANHYEGHVLVFGSTHWQEQPTAWPTARLIKGQVREDLLLGSDYQWWKTHNTFNNQFMVQAATPLADVQGALSPPISVSAGEVISVPVTVTNVGGVQAMGVAIALYDGEPDAGVFVARATLTGPLAVRGGAASTTINWTAWPEGAHRLCAVVNDDGAVVEPDSEGNVACRTVMVRAPGGGCDLSVLQPSLRVEPSAARPGEPVVLHATVTNVGTAACAATTVTLTDGPPANAVEVESIPVSALVPGATRDVSFAFSAQAGARQWLVTSDAQHALFDVDRSNDVASLQDFFSDAPLPDLTVESLVVTTPSPAFPGERVIANVRVRNLGSPSPQVELALSNGRTTGVPPLGAGEFADVSLEFTAGSATFLTRATVDPAGVLPELDETNNSRDVAVLCAPAPLGLAATPSPSSAGPGAPIGLQVRMTPQTGAGLDVELSVDVQDASGAVVAQLLVRQPRSVPGSGRLEALAWNTGTSPPGVYQFVVRAEAAGRLLGSTSAPIEVLAGMPALVASLTPNRGAVSAGRDIVLSFIALNASGNQTLSQLTGALSVFDPSARLVFREVRQVSALLAGGTYAGAAVVSMGANAQPGRYSAFIEFSTTTSSLAQAGAAFDVYVDPDMALVATLSADAAFQTGTPLPVSVLLENLSAQALSNETLTVELLNVELGLQVESLGAAMVSLAAGLQQTYPFLLPTKGVPTGPKLLVARVGGRVVDTRPVTALPLLDSEPPRIDVSGVNDGALVNHAVAPVVTVTDASPFTAVVLLDGAPFVAGSSVASEGAHTLTVEAQDVFGNRAWLVVRFGIDTTPPVLVLVGPLNGSLHATAQTLSWSATDDSPVTTAATLSPATISSGSVVALEGTFDWLVRAEDAAGNVTNEARQFSIDATPPVIQVGGVSDGQLTNEAVTLSFSATDPHLSALSATLNGLPIASGAAVIAEGSYVLVVTASDLVGNSATRSLSFELDFTPPLLSIAGVADGDLVRGPVSPVFSASDLHLTRLTATLNGLPFASGTSVSSDGRWELSVRAEDAAGNASSRSISFDLDATPPLIAVSGVVAHQVSASPLTPLALVTDAHLASTSLELDGSLFVNGSAVTQEGPHLLRVRASDTLGNTSEQSVDFTLDFSPPTITISGVFDGATGLAFTPVIQVSDATPVVTRITLDGLPFSSGTTVSSRGAHTLEVRATDAAGNLAVATVHFTVMAGSGACIDATLVAQRTYSPSRWTDARASWSAPLRMVVPWTIDVTQGNAGDKRVYLLLGLGSETTSCTYEGGSRVPHPTRPADVAAGLRYEFRSCKGGVQAGALVEVDSVRLHVHDGDFGWGPTSVRWNLQEAQPCIGAQPRDAGVGLDEQHCGHNDVQCNQELNLDGGTGR